MIKDFYQKLSYDESRMQHYIEVRLKKIQREFFNLALVLLSSIRYKLTDLGEKGILWFLTQPYGNLLNNQIG